MCATLAALSMLVGSFMLPTVHKGAEALVGVQLQISRVLVTCVAAFAAVPSEGAKGRTSWSVVAVYRQAQTPNNDAPPAENVRSQLLRSTMGCANKAKNDKSDQHICQFCFYK